VSAQQKHRSTRIDIQRGVLRAPTYEKRFNSFMKTLPDTWENNSFRRSESQQYVQNFSEVSMTTQLASLSGVSALSRGTLDQKHHPHYSKYKRH
jgi:hypothetical protein